MVKADKMEGSVKYEKIENYVKALENYTKIYKCQLCKTTFPSTEAYLKHFKKHHTDEP